MGIWAVPRETHHPSLLRQAFIGIVAMVALPLSTSPRSGATPKRRWRESRRHRASILRARFQYHLEKPVTLEKLSGSLGVESLVH